MLKTTQTLKAIVEAGQSRSDFEVMTMEEQTIAVAIVQLAGWLREHSPMLKNGGNIGVKIGVSEELASAIEASLRREDAAEVLPHLVKL